MNRPVRSRTQLKSLDADDTFLALLIGAMDARADLVLVDGKMERAEGRFLRQLASDLGLGSTQTKSILDVLRIKNGV